MEAVIAHDSDNDSLFAPAMPRPAGSVPALPVYRGVNAPTADIVSNAAADPAVIDRSERMDTTEVSYVVRLSYRSIRRKVLSGAFPPPIEGSRRPLMWHRADIERWLAR